MFEIWWSAARGMQAGPRFRELQDAVRYVEQHGWLASFAIRKPDGDWHRWESGRAIRPARHGPRYRGQRSEPVSGIGRDHRGQQH